MNKIGAESGSRYFDWPPATYMRYDQLCQPNITLDANSPIRYLLLHTNNGQLDIAF